MRVLAWRVPPFDNGTYLVIDDRGDAICVDPAMGEREVMRAIRDDGLRLLAILDTHGHDDHIFANAALKEATRARLAIHRLDAYRLDPARRPPSMIDLGEMRETAPDDLLEEGPLTYLRDVDVRSVHTPGHTEGSSSFHIPAEGILFTGDLLFAGSIGRTDLPGGDPGAMTRSLERVAAFDPATKVYPGHGPATTIERERRWLSGLLSGARAS
ncbi:MAG TPA: MBL fold metallo-hydrolase [Candidatus Limnocylindria bacterium]|nr:MBL fold metallo-hydrolase [Candidatus Limnocylindria bacterium]